MRWFMELCSNWSWRLDRLKQKAVVYTFNPKNYATHAWHNSITDWLLGRSSGSSPSTKAIISGPKMSKSQFTILLQFMNCHDKKGVDYCFTWSGPKWGLIENIWTSFRKLKWKMIPMILQVSEGSLYFRLVAFTNLNVYALNQSVCELWNI